jgi:hypothetical protein
MIQIPPLRFACAHACIFYYAELAWALTGGAGSYVAVASRCFACSICRSVVNILLLLGFTVLPPIQQLAYMVLCVATAKD